MAYGNMTPAVPGGIASSAANNQIIINVDDLDTRLDTVESRTTDTSGVVGIGNQRLSDRLGAGVTTSATADARFGSGVGTGSNVTTGSATSQLVDLRSRVSTLEAAAGAAAVWVKRTGTNTASGGGWTAVPFATLAQGTMTGVSTSDNITYTLQPGLWTVSVSLWASLTANLLGAIFEGGNVTPDDASNTEVYAVMSGGSAAGVAGVSLSTQIFVATATTRTFRVSFYQASGALRTGVAAPRLVISK